MLNNNIPRVVLDLGGGDIGYDVNLEALRLLSLKDELPFQIIAVGNIDKSEWNFDFELYNPTNKDSIKTGLELVKDGFADAFISIGDTSKIVSRAAFTYGRIENISRPALLTMFPTVKKKPAILLDIGATPVATTKNLLDFSTMASIYAENVLEWENPSLSLLSIGEESSKGSDAIRKAHSLLKDNDPDFIGNTEGRDIIQRKADIFVCEGLVGNIILKFAESMKDFFKGIFRKTNVWDLRSKIGAYLVAPTFRKILKDFDYTKYGGAILLGVDGICIIGHGRSNPEAVKTAIYLASKMATSDITDKLKATEFINEHQ